MPSQDRSRTGTPYRILIGALLGALLAPGVSPADDEPDPVGKAFVERVDVALVEVEVWAFDPEGQLVRDLTRDDFEVLQDGEPVPIAYFRAARGERSTPETPATVAPDAPAATPETAEPAYLVVYLDGAQLEPGGYRAAVAGVERILEEGEVPPERILILRHDEGLHVEVPFGSTREVIRDALASLAERSPSAVSAASDLEQTRQAVQDLWEQASDLSSSAGQGLAQAAGGGGTPREALQQGRAEVGIAPSGCDLFSQRVGPLVQGWALERAQRTARSLESLAQVASLVAGLPGAKSLLYVSDGLDVEPGASLASYVADFCPTQARSHHLETMGERLSEDIRSLARHFASHRVTIHAIEGSRLRTAAAGTVAARSTVGPPPGRLERLQRDSDREGLSALAVETGGRQVFDRNALGEDFLGIARDLSGYYLLAYQPPSPSGGAPGEHEITVRARDPELTLRYRRGYRETAPDEAIEEGLLGALHLGITSNPLGLRIGMGSTTETDLVKLYLMLPGTSLAAGPAETEATVELALRGLLRSIPAADVEPVEQEYRVRIPAGATAERIDLPLSLHLEPGPYDAAFALRNGATGETSFVTTSFEVPPP